MDKTLTREFFHWLARGPMRNRLRRVDLDRELPGFMDEFLEEWFSREAMKARYDARYPTGEGDGPNQNT